LFSLVLQHFKFLFHKVPSFCSSPKDEGLCSANLTRYYFNSRNKACETFTYTGCGGNENNFYYLDDCDHACAKGRKALHIQSTHNKKE
ncbi:Tissue factor pathway inhibitor 2, partial [Lemmus lemmus]